MPDSSDGGISAAACCRVPAPRTVPRSRGAGGCAGSRSRCASRVYSSSTSRCRLVVYPLPSRVTYTREIDFDDQGGIWTSNSNTPRLAHREREPAHPPAPRERGTVRGAGAACAALIPPSDESACKTSSSPTRLCGW